MLLKLSLSISLLQNENVIFLKRNLLIKYFRNLKVFHKNKDLVMFSDVKKSLDKVVMEYRGTKAGSRRRESHS